LNIGQKLCTKLKFCTESNNNSLRNVTLHFQKLIHNKWHKSWAVYLPNYYVWNFETWKRYLSNPICINDHTLFCNFIKHIKTISSIWLFKVFSYILVRKINILVNKQRSFDIHITENFNEHNIKFLKNILFIFI